ncbi:MAG TPA: hypothetical protein DCG85_03510 [Lachnospiraceae bacterium]|nr:hypothetical protein [Lachnospiraceae bacterium]
MEILQDRYRIEKILNCDGAMIRYDAYDTFREQAVEIFELYPTEIVTRDEDKKSVKLKKISDEGIFKQMRDDMEREARKLIPLYPLDHIAGVITYFNENNTIYFVTEKTKGISLDTYIRKKIHGANMTVKAVYEMASPMLKTLDMLHEKGVIHGRISPDLIDVGEDGKMVLTGIVSPMKFMEGINENYSPVEQFAENGQILPETDIYAFGAVIYRLTTGNEVLPFYERLSEDNPEGKDPILEPSRYNGGIMDYQSDAIMKAISIYHFDRYKTFAELLKAIEQEDYSDTGQIRKREAPIKLINEWKYKRTILWGFVAAIVILGLFFIPKAFDLTGRTGAKAFYKKLIAADDYTKCRMIDDLGKTERKTFANDYSQMEEEGEHDIRYYDLITERFSDYGSIDKSGKHLRYVSLDYRLNGQAILKVHYDGDETVMTVTLKETSDNGYYIEKTESKEGKIADSFVGIIHDNKQEEK